MTLSSANLDTRADTRRAGATHWRVTRYGGADAFLSDVSEHSPATGFQSATWLSHLLGLARAENATLVLVALEPQSGGGSLLLPLAVKNERGARVARFADFGLTDYNVPVGALQHRPVGGHAPAAEAESIVAALRAAQLGIDVLRLERLPPMPGNVLASHPRGRRARLAGNTLTLAGTVEEMLRARGKKYRKEVERCYRVLESEGAWEFAEARSPSERHAAYSASERQQAERHAGNTGQYALARPHVSSFYRNILDAPTGLARLFMLSVDGEMIAALLGIVHGRTFTLLRIANGGPAWRHVSPGRLVVVEAMKRLLPEGVTTFDMGIGDYAFKRGFGCERVPLVDVVVPLTVRGLPYATALAVKTRGRESERVRAFVSRLRGVARGPFHSQVPRSDDA